MHLFIPIAGRSSRFKSVSDTPKWALDVAGVSMLERAVTSITGSGVKIDEITIVAQSQHEGLLNATLERFSEPVRAKIFLVEEVTRGQALSVAAAIAADSASGPGGVLIWNGDTALLDGWEAGLDISGDFLLVSELDGNHWSFAEVGENGVIRTAEKERISRHASVGLYGFSSRARFLESVSSFGDQGEVFVAPLYNQIIQSGFTVRIESIPVHCVIPLGTPEEVISSCKRFGWGLPDWHRD